MKINTLEDAKAAVKAYNAKVAKLTAEGTALYKQIEKLGEQFYHLVDEIAPDIDNLLIAGEEDEE